MLSILIPTYNYNVYPLVENLVRRAVKSDIIFEIICIDDGSKSKLNPDNKNINSLAQCKFIERQTNKGRTETRQELAERAQYNWLLFLDADVMPKNDAFLTQYISLINEPYKAVFGGIAYSKSSYSKNNALRYTFGSKREVVDAKKRNAHPYRVICSANFMMQKSLFLKTNASILENTYGLDYVFGVKLKSQHIHILHVDNEVYHLGIDDNADYLNKTKKALQTLLQLYTTNQINNSEIRLIKAYNKLQFFGLSSLYGKLIGFLNKAIESHLLNSKSPNLFVFDLYRLGYFCRIKSNT
ncbi:glycosyltransferase family 2 protein [Hanstruepera marina]|uniref:glycosyltransferase family 2 protein n=1 Tax=Hanstruepera marina TaxID=2873265 RepID=UPI001CA62124|nr:glycosyltransferase family A protein [Hanstruepera marina]